MPFPILDKQVRDYWKIRIRVSAREIGQRQRKHQASATKWKWTQIIFLSARIFKSIPSLLATYLFFFFFSCCLLRVMMNFFLQVAVEIRCLYSPRYQGATSMPTQVKTQHSWVSAYPRALQHLSPSFLFAVMGIESTFPASLLPSGNW